MLLLTDDFRSLCGGATVYLDTNVFICAQEQVALAQLVENLQDRHRTACVTFSSVEYEFTRGSQSLEELKARRLFVRNLVKDVLPVGKLLENDKNDAFSAAMSLVVGPKNSQYTDYLLAVALHAYKNAVEKQFILSADARAFSIKLFDIEGAVTLDRKNGEIAHIHLISLNEQKYGNLLQSIERSAV